jgi:NADPH-dependent 2,4-dienoyl-CoA reductase/sulfur reductase-like enzyme
VLPAAAPELREVVIIGAGQAGARAALAIRECAPDVAITIYGLEPHAPYERPELSKSLLLNPALPVPHVLRPEQFAAHRIDLRAGCPIIAIDRNLRRVVAADGSSAGYDRLLLATGSRLREIAIAGVPPAEILYLRTLDDCRALEARLRSRPKLAVIGGGLIGLEIAASASRRGCRVTVVEAGGGLLARLGCAELSAIVAAHHRSRGIDIRLGVHVVEGRGGELHLSDGSSVAAEVLVAGIGVAPETSLAEASGLAVDDGILVDSNGRTSDPLIYAAGDVTRQRHSFFAKPVRLESWQNANDQAYAAGRSLAGYPNESNAVPWIWSDQGDLNIQAAGAGEGADRIIVRGSPEDPDGVCICQLAGDRLIGAFTLNRGADMAMIRRLIGQRELALPPDCLADPEIPLRKFAFSRRAA